jgi:molecular chaperone DnaK
VPQIEVTFDIDANGIVNVSAKDMATNKEQKITITASSGLSKEEVDRMMKEAESHSEEDKKRKEEIETRNQADQAVYVGEKTLRDSGDKLGAAERAAIESAINDLKSSIEQNDIAGMKKRMDALNQAQHKAAEAMYKAASGAGGGGQTGSGSADQGSSSRSASQGDVIDAEVVEEEKK